MRRLKLRRKQKNEAPRTAASGSAGAGTSAEAAAPTADGVTTSGSDTVSKPIATQDAYDCVQPEHPQTADANAPNCNPHLLVEGSGAHSQGVPPSMQAAPRTSGKPTSAGLDDEETASSNYNVKDLGGTRSFELWNKAFDALGTEAETADVAAAYKKTLAKVLVDEKLLATGGPSGTTTAADHEETQATILNQLEDRSQRQELLARFVKEGQERVKLSKTVERAGSFADAIMALAPIVNVVLQIPHAAPTAIPWAGVLVGLQVCFLLSEEHQVRELTKHRFWRIQQKRRSRISMVSATSVQGWSGTVHSASTFWQMTMLALCNNKWKTDFWIFTKQFSFTK